MEDNFVWQHLPALAQHAPSLPPSDETRGKPGHIKRLAQLFANTAAQPCIVDEEEEESDEEEGNAADSDTLTGLPKNIKKYKVDRRPLQGLRAIGEKKLANIATERREAREEAQREDNLIRDAHRLLFLRCSVFSFTISQVAEPVMKPHTSKAEPPPLLELRAYS